MIKIFTIVCISLFTVSTSETTDRLPLLCGSTGKSWYLYSKTPETGAGACLASSPASQDNNFIFQPDGTFEFDHGTLTEDAGCNQEDCCSDIINVIGTWAFTNVQNGLRVIALRAKDGATADEPAVLFNATIDYLDDNTLKISQLDPETNVRHYFEFRKR